MDQKQYVKALDTENAYRLFNLGSTVLVEASNGEDLDVMPASWVCPLDFSKMSMVIDASHYTRRLMEKNPLVLLSVAGSGIVNEVLRLGTVSKNDNPLKLEESGLQFMNVEGCPMPLPEGCSAWALVRLFNESHIEKTYDLFVGEIIAAWADERVCPDGHWALERGPESLRPIHYVSGGRFYELGSPIDGKV